MLQIKNGIIFPSTVPQLALIIVLVENTVNENKNINAWVFS